MQKKWQAVLGASMERNRNAKHTKREIYAKPIGVNDFYGS